MAKEKSVTTPATKSSTKRSSIAKRSIIKRQAASVELVLSSETRFPVQSQWAHIGGLKFQLSLNSRDSALANLERYPGSGTQEKPSQAFTIALAVDDVLFRSRTSTLPSEKEPTCTVPIRLSG